MSKQEGGNGAKKSKKNAPENPPGREKSCCLTEEQGGVQGLRREISTRARGLLGGQVQVDFGLGEEVHRQLRPPAGRP